MSEFWIFLAIAGVIISFARKEDQARKRRGNTGQGMPKENPQEELERQLRELFGEETPAAPKPKPAEFTTPTEVKYTLPKPKPIASVNTPKENVSASKENKSKSSSTTESTQIDDMIKDFTMKKAVIYSEILKPKFDEY